MVVLDGSWLIVANLECPVASVALRCRDDFPVFGLTPQLTYWLIAGQAREDAVGGGHEMSRRSPVKVGHAAICCSSASICTGTFLKSQTSPTQLKSFNV
jgi:hypothetical protein